MTIDIRVVVELSPALAALAERLVAALAAREQGTRAGVADGASSARPPTEAGGTTPVMAAEEDADTDTGAPTGVVSVPSAPQPIGRPSNTGGEAEGDRHPPAAAQRPPAPPEPPSVRRPAPQPAAPAPVPPVTWRTPAREAVLRRLWPDASHSMRDIWTALGRVPGPALPSTMTNAYQWAAKLDLGSRPVKFDPAPLAAANRARAVVAAQADADAGAEDAPVPLLADGETRETPQLQRARELLAMGLHLHDIRQTVRLTASEYALIVAAHASRREGG